MDPVLRAALTTLLFLVSIFQIGVLGGLTRLSLSNNVLSGTLPSQVGRDRVCPQGRDLMFIAVLISPF